MFRLLCLLLGMALVSPCQAERFALLIGLSEVKAAKPSPPLQGIANDLEMGREIALRLGIPAQQHRVFSDVGKGLAPTYANITRAMSDLQSTVSTGDFVLLYLSGHGVRQRSKAPESDAFDVHEEVFLLQDSWTDPQGPRVVNALVDKTLRQWLASLDRQGVTVWVIADTCHAGSITRDLPSFAGEDFVFLGYKGLRSAWLGVLNGRVRQYANVDSGSVSRMRLSDLPRVSVFMAADDAGSALEIELKRDGRKVGLFTWVLHSVLMQSESPTTPSRLSQAVLSRYQRYPKWVVRPVFEVGQ